MAQTEKEVIVKRVDMECECGNGVMRPDGVVLTSMPPQYPHACTSCKRRETYRITYPYHKTEDQYIYNNLT